MTREPTYFLLWIQIAGGAGSLQEKTVPDAERSEDVLPWIQIASDELALYRRSTPGVSEADLLTQGLQP